MHSLRAFVHVIAPLIVAGAGVSLAMPAAQSAVLGAVTPSEVGKASGIFNTSRFLGGTFGIALAVAAFAAAGKVVGERAFSGAFAAAIAISAALSLAAAIAALALPTKREVVAGQGRGLTHQITNDEKPA